jgi:hypothetical protein
VPSRDIDDSEYMSEKDGCVGDFGRVGVSDTMHAWPIGATGTVNAVRANGAEGRPGSGLDVDQRHGVGEGVRRQAGCTGARCGADRDPCGSRSCGADLGREPVGVDASGD